MPTLSTRVTDGELKAITEYANASGLSVSDLMKKVLIHKICWLWIGNDEDKDFAEMYHADPEGNLYIDEKLVNLSINSGRWLELGLLKVGYF